MPGRASPFSNTHWLSPLGFVCKSGIGVSLSGMLCRSEPESPRWDCPAGFEPQLLYVASVLLLPHVLLLSAVIVRLCLARTFYVGT